ncbi:hypothetical protein M404DRAFT_1002555 [Pisolithus tinctorius Marx 270]|uniref:Uncharacterized protein n=1 Tax=Pisolithus tinctorius Marx 270 TaxID=870435 RepID=A0A0C3NMJ8_PISTI|nr:hypothetical protein M404DRAFT_1002555 [Pisolithus tinctorius Marx 270]
MMTLVRHAGVSGIASAHHGTGNVKSFGKDHLLLVPLGDQIRGQVEYKVSLAVWAARGAVNLPGCT